MESILNAAVLLSLVALFVYFTWKVARIARRADLSEARAEDGGPEFP